MNCPSAVDIEVQAFLVEVRQVFDAFAKASITVNQEIPEGIEGREVARPMVTPELCKSFSKQASKLIKDIDCENY